MQHVNQVVTNLFPDPSKTKNRSAHTSQSLTTVSKKVLAGAWQMLLSRRLVHAPVGSIEHRTFERDMSDLTEAQIRNGIERCKDFTGFFSTPAFRELCKTIDTAALGLPDTKTAYVEACRAPSPKAKFKWSHPAVYHAGVATGWHELSSFPEDQIYPRFKTFYAGFCERVMKGESLDSPMMEALPERVSVILTPEQNQSRMASLREVTGL